MSEVQRLIEKCRRQQRQKPGQLEISELDDMTIGDIEEDEMWREHTTERIKQMESERLMAIYRQQADFMLTLREAARGTWASAEEALEEWRSRTVPDWGFAPSWID